MCYTRTVASWRELEQELEAWKRAGGRCSLWWRDDDAADDVVNLTGLAGSLCRIPVAYAAIPSRLTAAVVKALQVRPAVVLQHGYSHANYALPGKQKIELASTRPLSEVRVELDQGRRLLEGWFGMQAPPVLVPPWNRIASSVEQNLFAWGFRGLSTFHPRQQRSRFGVHVVNVHVDLVAWGDSPCFVGEELALERLLKHLVARRSGTVDPDEPTGFLSHHRSTGEAGFAFVEELTARLCIHQHVEWVDPLTLFARQ